MEQLSVEVEVELEEPGPAALPVPRLMQEVLQAAAGGSTERLQSLWRQVHTHQEALCTALGRPVHPGVALVDLVASLGEEAPPAPEDSVRRLLEALRRPPPPSPPGREQFLRLLQFALDQRQTTRTVVLVLEGAPQDEETAARLGALLPTRLRRGDVVAHLGGARFALLLPGCPPGRAPRLALKLEEEVRRALAGRLQGLSMGAAEGERGESAEALLLRAEHRCSVTRGPASSPEVRTAAPRAEAPAPAAPADTTPVARRPLALFIGPQASTYLELQRAFSAHGALLLWARERRLAERAFACLGPDVVLADVLAPPIGGQALLEALLGPGPRLPALLVAPRRWSTLQKGQGSAPVLGTPLEEGQAQRLLHRLFGAARPPLPPIAAESTALAVHTAMAHFIQGRRPPTEQLEGLEGRPEIALLHRQLRA